MPISLNFNPRSYKRSDMTTKGIEYFYDISIHAPTRGATCGEFEVLYPNIISIHAPTRGATILQCKSLFIGLFQSTLLQEERHTCRLVRITSRRISIHAPTRGATRLHARLSLKWSISIHAPTRGAT